MKDTPTPAITVRKAHRRIATVSADRPGAALPVPAELDAEPAASCDGASFWAAPWHCQVDFWQRSALFLDLLRQRAAAAQHHREAIVGGADSRVFGRLQ